MSRKVHALLVLAPLGLVVAAAFVGPLEHLYHGCRAAGPRQARADLRACAPAVFDAECAQVFRDPMWRTRGGTGCSYEHGTIHGVRIDRFAHRWMRTALFGGGAARRSALIQFVQEAAEAAGAAPAEIDEFGCATWRFADGVLDVCAGWMNWTPRQPDSRASAAVSAIWVEAGEVLLREL